MKRDWINEELRRGFDKALRRGKVERQAYPHAVAARFDAASRHIVVKLDNGALFSFPPGLAQGLAAGTDDALAEIELTPSGSGLLWPKLGAALSIEGLLLGVFRSKVWMRELARRGGQFSSAAKTAAARANGMKGGRPRKIAAA